MRTRRFSSSPAARPSRQKLTNEASSPPQLLAMSHIFCWTQGALKTTEGKAEVPSLDKEGWLRPLRKCREAPLEAQTGWLVQATDYRKLNEPPRPRLQRNGTIYLMARPPLLCQGGDFAFPSGCPRRLCHGRLVGNDQPSGRGCREAAGEGTKYPFSNPHAEVYGTGARPLRAERTAGRRHRPVRRARVGRTRISPCLHPVYARRLRCLQDFGLGWYCR